MPAVRGHGSVILPNGCFPMLLQNHKDDNKIILLNRNKPARNLDLFLLLLDTLSKPGYNRHCPGNSLLSVNKPRPDHYRRKGPCWNRSKQNPGSFLKNIQSRNIYPGRLVPVRYKLEQMWNHTAVIHNTVLLLFSVHLCYQCCYGISNVLPGLSGKNRKL